MSQIMGWEGRVEYIEEATYGTPTLSSSLAWVGDVRSYSVGVSVDKKHRKRLAPRGSTTQRVPDSMLSGLEHTIVKVEYCPQASSATYDPMDLVGVCLGSNSGVANTRKSAMFNCVAKETVVEGPVKGCVNNYFQASCSVGEDVIFEMEFTGQYWDPSAPLSVTADLSGATDSYLQATEASGADLTWNDTEVKISGTTCDLVTDWEFKVDNQTEERPRINGTTYPAENVQKQALITGKITIDLEDNTELLRFMNKTSFALIVKVGGNTFTFSGCEWEKDEIEVNPDDPIQTELPFKALSVAIT